ncbi:MAG: cache domain-containing protein [Campylobacterota bacterium]|nr:cache domain-containing protein [Campylobacterota bacterium]
MEKVYTMHSSEKNLLLLIKIVPIIVIVLFSTTATYFAINQNNKNYDQKLLDIKKELTDLKKQRIKEEVRRVYGSISFEKSTTEKKLKESIKERVYEAYGILSNLYKENKTKPKEQIKKILKDALRDIRFNNGRGYYFLYEMNGKNVLLPPNKKLEGKDFSNFKDAKGVYTNRGMSEVVKNNTEGFYTWWWYKPNNKETQFKKIGFGKYFEPFDWFIGTGEYFVDFENDMKREMLDKIEYIRYGQNGYIFVFDYDGVTLSHIKKEYINKNRIDIQDPNGFMITKELLKTARQGEGFIEYIATIKPTTGEASQKISFIKGIDDWNWAIGSGFYTDDLKKEILKRADEIKQTQEIKLNRIIIFSIALTITFLIFSLLMSHFIKKIFLNYKVNVKKRDNQLAEQSKLAAMGEMIGNIAHQWRQPLSIISTASTGMKMKKELNILEDKEFYELCDMIDDNSQYLSKTIDDFRNFIKGDRKKVEFSLSDDINSFLHLVEGSIKSNNITLQTKLDDSLRLYGYPSELIQCFINIFNNAKDAFKNSNSDKYFFIDTYKKEETIYIELKDNAGGIPDDVIDHIFEPYFTTKHKSNGTGLGLSMSRNLIIDGMNGEISVLNESFSFKKNKFTGAKFIIKLPLRL